MLLLCLFPGKTNNIFFFILLYAFISFAANIAQKIFEK